MAELKQKEGRVDKKNPQQDMKWVITTDMAHAHTQQGAGRCASLLDTQTHTASIFRTEHGKHGGGIG